MEPKISKFYLGLVIIGIFLVIIGVDADTYSIDKSFVNRDVNYIYICNNPDLTITSLTADLSNPVIGQTINFKVVINETKGYKTNFTSAYYYLDDTQKGTIFVGYLNKSSVTKTFTLQCTGAGSHNVKVKVDPDDKTKECSETNNEKTITITCSKKPTGALCTNNDECESGKCYGGICKPGAYCTSDAECVNGYCEGNECKTKKENGMSCTGNNQCNSGYCNNNFCCASGTCCGSNQDCPSNKPICLNSQCNLCTNDVQCESNKYCENGECKQKKNNDIQCSAAKECLSNYCVHNLCRATETFCGDNYCDSGETTTCPVDCGCKSNENCSSNQICNITTHQCDDLTCSEGQQAQNHACVQIQGYCISNENCSSNQICNITTHQCDDLTCSEGQQAQNHACVQIPGYSAPSVGIGGIPTYVIIIAVFVIILLVLVVLWKKPSKLSVIANPTEIPADGKSASTILVTIKNLFGKAISVKSETSVVLSTSLGTITNQITIPKDSTSATAVLTSSTTDGKAKVSVVASIGATQEGMLPKEVSSIGGIGTKIPKISGGKKTLMGEVEVTFTQVTSKRYCMHCGALMMSEKDPCPRCGKLPPSGVDTKICPNCNAVIPITAKFCRMCGAGQQK